MERRYYSES